MKNFCAVALNPQETEHLIVGYSTFTYTYDWSQPVPTWTDVGPFPNPRSFPDCTIATLDPGPVVIVAEGISGSVVQSQVDIFDVVTRSW